MICQDFLSYGNRWLFVVVDFMYKKSGYFGKQVLLISAAFSGEGMSTTPLWLVQNVRLPDREGLWQIAIENGRFGAITPMDEPTAKAMRS